MGTQIRFVFIVEIDRLQIGSLLRGHRDGRCLWVRLLWPTWRCRRRRVFRLLCLGRLELVTHKVAVQLGLRDEEIELASLALCLAHFFLLSCLF